MRFGLLVVAFGCALGCTPRHVATPSTQPLKPAPPPPPGRIHAWGPMRIDAVDMVRTDVGWDRDLVRATRNVVYDVVLSQERATCSAKTPPSALVDAEGCGGVAEIPTSCTIEPRMRARVEVTVTFVIDIAHRCAGDPNVWALPASGDARNALTTAGIACFRTRNKLKPESTWTSLYELTELQLGERVSRVTTSFPRLLGRLASTTQTTTHHCRDDGAYLDGTGGRAIKPDVPLDDATTNEIANALARLAPTTGGDPANIPLTTTSFQTEHALWEKCNTQPAKESLIAQERCLLLRQLDRFVRDVEDAARPETPKTSSPIATDGGA